ncbi:type I-B CRISPR-associated endonuclease Cas1b [Thermotoga sp. KOL6]|uniref:type I-B CRISPR-associated endonuclease Cas1b n=1 Tax=Thermotoga sp. KOL6 TaxID=126741 RepID=UPI000C75D33D|nr:type I-B CRISPR-associated endonuclease Cas1b [Thermotoga sp. KOL6]PLV58068.1 type I-B CRISPR-associated endonuclease Cas1 [Thermotoga sp. KOL6]
MESVYIFSSGRLRRKSNTLCVESEGGKKYIPVENILDIKIFGEVDFNKRLLEFLTQKRIILHFFNREGYYVGTYYPREFLNSGFLILRQVEHFLDHKKRISIARSIVMGSLNSMMSFLKDNKVEYRKLKELSENLESVNTVEQLMAIEGNAREEYYSLLDSLVDEEAFRIKKRTRRPPQNYANTLLSFGNSLLYTTVLSLIYQTHLDPRVGYLHETNFRRFTLNLDVAELFKPLIIDKIVISMIRLKRIQKRHFNKISNGLMLNDEGKKLFLSEYEKFLRKTVHHKKMNRYVSFRGLIKMELHRLEKHLVGEQNYSAFSTSMWS